MHDRFDALDFLHYAGSRWRWVALACGIAIGLAGVGSAMLPKRYTATASVMIDPPTGVDARSTTVLSSVYLDSLKTYERLASSDTVFFDALDHLKLREKFAGRSTESLKRSVLLINRPANTRVIEISATLDDPRTAQGLAQYIAEKTVALNRALQERTAIDAEKDAQTVVAAAQVREEAAEKADVRASGTDAMRVEMQNAADLKYRVERDLGEAKAELAVTDSATVRARVTELKAQAEALGQTVAARGLSFEQQQQQQDRADADLRTARAALEGARAKADEIRTASAFRSERLDVFDPGIVPERPSYPNTSLNLILAALLAMVSSAIWLAVRFGYERTQAVRSERAFSLR